MAAGLIAVWLFAPVNTDERWGYGVITAVMNGEKLYGDVFFGSTPLSVLAGVASLDLRLPDLLAVRSVTTAGCAIAMLARTTCCSAAEFPVPLSSRSQWRSRSYSCPPARCRSTPAWLWCSVFRHRAL